jgi:hypothetical protein
MTKMSSRLGDTLPRRSRTQAPSHSASRTYMCLRLDNLERRGERFWSRPKQPGVVPKAGGGAITSGEFSVKSAYKLYVQKMVHKLHHRMVQIAISSGKQFGNYHVYRKYNNMCGVCLVHNGLPLMTCIKRRGMDCDTRCVCCRRLDEDKVHLFFKCKKMKKEWERLEMETIRECSCSCQSAHAVIEELPLLTENEKCKVCCSIWRWWTRRNKINAKEPAIISLDACFACRGSRESAQYCTIQRASQQKIEVEAWTAPSNGCLKINYNESYISETRHGG